MQPAMNGDALWTEEVAVYMWRIEQLRRQGLSLEECGAAADQVDWHAIADLVRRGCPPRLALEIVR